MILAIQTRTQKKRQQQQDKADAEATAQAGAKITPVQGNQGILAGDEPARETKEVEQETEQTNTDHN